MQIISDTTDFHIDRPCAVAIGKFDGVHIGHRKLLDVLLQQKKKGLAACVFTFDPSPEVFFGAQVKELSDREEKRYLFEQLGVDILIEFPFNSATAAMEPEDFIRQILAGQLHTRFVAAGSDLSFGARGEGNFDTLRKLSKSCGFEAVQIDKVVLNGRVVSSTLIRQLTAEGRMEEVAACLGEPYLIMGTIRHGRQLGRKINIPTMNQMPPEDKLLPPFGVYYSVVEFDDQLRCGMTNIGCKPTVSKDNSVTVETYLYDFSGDLYGKTARTRLLTYRRPEKKFSGIAQLQKVMQSDVNAGREYFAVHDWWQCCRRNRAGIQS